MTDIAMLDGGLGQEILKRSMANAHPLWSVKVMFDQPDIVTKVQQMRSYTLVWLRCRSSDGGRECQGLPIDT